MLACKSFSCREKESVLLSVMTVIYFTLGILYFLFYFILPSSMTLGGF